MHPSASLFVTVGMTAIPLLVVLLLIAGVRHVAPERAGFASAACVGWLGVTALVASSGVLTHFDARPPPLLVMMLGTLVVGVGLGVSSLGGRLARGVPLWALVAVQAFRFPLELVMHSAANEGTMPVEMTFTGLNFDIVTGISAIVVAIAIKNGAPQSVALVWSVIGSLLLAAIMSIAVAATPAVHAFGGGAHLNTWIAYAPFVWLPTVLVAAALAGHIIVFRALAISTTDREGLPKAA